MNKPKKTAPKKSEKKAEGFEQRKQRNFRFGSEIEEWACASAQTKGFRSTAAFYLEVIRQAYEAESKQLKKAA